MSSAEHRARAALQERTDWLRDLGPVATGDWIDDDVFSGFHRLGVIRKANWIRDTKMTPSAKSGSGYLKVHVGFPESQDAQLRVLRRDLTQLFSELADAWEAETFMTSSLEKQVLNEAYQRIIGLGPDAVSLVVKRLLEVGGNWFWALRAMTGEDPISQGEYGDYEAMRSAWIRWAVERGLVDGS